MAVAYAAIANGGDIVRPHVGLRVEDPQGRAIQEIDPAIRDHVEIDPPAQRTIMDGLHGAAMEPGGHLVQGLRRLPGRHRRARPAPPRPGIGIDQSWYIAAGAVSTTPSTWSR